MYCWSMTQKGCESQRGGDVGIGTSFVGSALDVFKAGANSYIRSQTVTSGNTGIQLLNNGNQQYDILADRSNNRLQIRSSVYNFITMNAGTGNVGIGTTSPSYALHVIGQIGATSEITAYASDSRLKMNVTRIENPLEKIMSINGVTFEWSPVVNDLGFFPEKKTDVGVIAQEIQSVLPEIVRMAPFDKGPNSTSISGENYLTVQYEKLTALLIEAVKEQQKQITEQSEKIAELEKLVKGPAN